MPPGSAVATSRLWSDSRASELATWPGTSGAVPVTAAADAAVNGAANTEARRSTTWSVVVQQPEAPVEGRTGRPVPVIEPSAAGQQDQLVAQPGLQAVHPQRGHARGRQLDGQGDPIELLADASDPVPVARVRRRPAGHRGALDEQLPGVALLAAVLDREPGHREDRLVRDHQPHPARREHGGARAAR